MFTWNNKISVKLPVQPYNDLFEKMTDNQMASFKTKLISLRDALSNAVNDSTVQIACTRLGKVFGADFPAL